MEILKNISRHSFAILLLTTLTACGSADRSSDSQTASDNTSPRIINGTTITRDQLPQVKALLVQIEDQLLHNCTGTFISQRHFLTAGHCVAKIPVELMRLEMAPGHYVVPVAAATHPLYRPDTALESVYHPGLAVIPADVAIITVGEKYQGPLSPIYLGIPPNGLPIMIAGFGTIDFTGQFGAGELRVGNTTIELVSPEEGVFYWTFDQGEANTCKGDSGGPAFGFLPDGSPVIVGVTSGGDELCGVGTRSVDTLVPVFADWIHQVTKGEAAFY